MVVEVLVFCSGLWAPGPAMFRPVCNMCVQDAGVGVPLPSDADEPSASRRRPPAGPKHRAPALARGQGAPPAKTPPTARAPAATGAGGPSGGGRGAAVGAVVVRRCGPPSLVILGHALHYCSVCALTTALLRSPPCHLFGAAPWQCGCRCDEGPGSRASTGAAARGKGAAGVGAQGPAPEGEVVELMDVTALLQPCMEALIQVRGPGFLGKGGGSSCSTSLACGESHKQAAVRSHSARAIAPAQAVGARLLSWVDKTVEAELQPCPAAAAPASAPSASARAPGSLPARERSERRGWVPLGGAAAGEGRGARFSLSVVELYRHLRAAVEALAQRCLRRGTARQRAHLARLAQQAVARAVRRCAAAGRPLGPCPGTVALRAHTEEAGRLRRSEWCVPRPLFKSGRLHPLDLQVHWAPGAPRNVGACPARRRRRRRAAGGRGRRGRRRCAAGGGPSAHARAVLHALQPGAGRRPAGDLVASLPGLESTTRT